MQEPVAPFLYDGYVRRLRSRGGFPGSEASVVIWGGRNLGKSTLLRQLHAETARESGASLILGRSPNAEALVDSWILCGQRPLFLDDLDQLPDTPRDAVLDYLASGSGQSLVVTVRDPEELPEVGNFAAERLDPWFGDWERELGSACRDSLDAYLRLSGCAPLGSEVLEAWMRTIREVSGGYPVLVHAAVRYLGLLVTDRAKLNTPLEHRLISGPAEGEDREVWQRLLKVALEDHLVDRALPLVRHTVRDLRHRRPDLFEHLVKMSRGKTEVSSIARKELRDTGLAYTGSDGTFSIASPLIAEWVKHVAEQVELDRQREARRAAPTDTGTSAVIRLPASRQVRIDIVGDNSYEGVLRYAVEGGAPIQLPVTGSPWRLLRCLAEAKGEPQSVMTLSRVAGLGSDTAVRSAMQRLQKLLRESHLVNVIDNVRGRGYRLGSFPTHEPP